MSLTCNYIGQLSDDALLFEAVQEYFAEGVKAGQFPSYREAPTGDESVLFVGSHAAPLAFATFFPVHTSGLWLDLFYVRPPHRRKGIGRHLLTGVKSWAHEHDFDRVLFGTLSTNSAMLGLARATGFGLEGHFLAGESGKVEATEA